MLLRSWMWIFVFSMEYIMLLSSSFFFFKQKTAYEWRIRDWSSDVCSSDLDSARAVARPLRARPRAGPRRRTAGCGAPVPRRDGTALLPRIGRRGADPVPRNRAARRRRPVGGRQAAFPAGGACRAPRGAYAAGALPAHVGQRRPAAVAPHRPRNRRTGAVLRAPRNARALPGAVPRARHRQDLRGAGSAAVGARVPMRPPFAARPWRAVLPHARGRWRGPQRDAHRRHRARHGCLALTAAAGPRSPKRKN